jgi:hypothetical protein
VGYASICMLAASVLAHLVHGHGCELQGRKLRLPVLCIEVAGVCIEGARPRGR